MPFGWGGSSSPSVPTRDAHIQGFLSHQTFSRGTKNCPTDRGCNLFETSFAPSANASPYTLQVYLSAAFPKQPPVITLLRPNLATHPILNENMQCVKLNSLSGWGGGQAGVMLVQVVEEVASSLIQRAPNVVGGGPASPAKPPSYDEARRSSRSRSMSSNGESKTGGGDDVVFHMPIPPVPSKFPDLEGMSDSAIAHLLNDDVARATYIENMPSVKTIVDLKESISAGNLEAAKVNLSQEEEIGSLHAEAQVMQAELREATLKFEEVVKEARGALDGLSEKEVLALVNSAKLDAESKSDDMSSAFQDGDIAIDNFVKQYLAERERYHERAAKIERMQRQQRY